jgi:hypothetical protein
MLLSACRAQATHNPCCSKLGHSHNQNRRHSLAEPEAIEATTPTKKHPNPGSSMAKPNGGFNLQQATWLQSASNDDQSQVDTQHSSFASLPDEVLTVVMQHVPHKDRLISCCLVSKRLHAAAVAATYTLECTTSSPQHTASAFRWVTSYGQNLTSITLFQLPQPLRELCCPKLVDLRVLNGGSLQLGAAGGYPGVVAGCTRLTRLQLAGIDLTDAPEGGVLDSTSCLVNLRYLVVEPTHPADVSGATLRSNNT